MANILVLGGEKDILRLVVRILMEARNDTATPASSLAQAEVLAQQQSLDLIVLDFIASIGEHDGGISVYQQIRRIESLRQVPVLFWMVPNPTRIYPEAQQLGVAGCVTMPSPPAELVKARDVILAGGTYYPSLT